MVDSGSPGAQDIARGTIFVSHAHADRELASALVNFVERSFSGVVRTFLSSDPRAAQGLQPGDQWFSRIHAELEQSLQVWVLATPQSLGRPWIYWEAGIGSELCPEGVVVLRVGVDAAPSPLSAFYAFDGERAEDNGIGSLLDKIASTLRMNVDPVLRDSVVQEWLTFVESYSPAEAAADEASPLVAPEQLGRLDAAITRIEALAVRWDLSPPPRSRRLGARTSFMTVYGTGLSPGDVVGVYAAGAHCGDIDADANGNWVGQVGPDGADSSSCDAVAGDMLTFKLNGAATNATETYANGGTPSDAANGISLTLV